MNNTDLFAQGELLNSIFILTVILKKSFFLKGTIIKMEHT